jgi:protein-S-isoprenylcysteine O-methyltransferase Ste14
MGWCPGAGPGKKVGVPGVSATEQTVFWSLIVMLFAVGAITALLLLFITAPYGRHARGGWGLTIPSRYSWILMESPAVILFVGIYAMGRNALDPVPLGLLALWQVHYIHRTFIYPLRMYPDRSHKTALSVALMGFTFQVINSYVNARWISEMSVSYTTDWLTDPRFILGVALFVYGFRTNRWADRVLRRLKAEGRGYQIPTGGLYDLVSCPNYLGELMIWGGWALATWSVAGLSFFWFTATNLVPRAISNHRWYREKFPDYPASRRAILPWLL